MDQCLFNRTSTIDGRQCTIGLHVDDGLVTCKSKAEIDLLISQLKAEFEITTHEGPIIEYLGIRIDFSGDDARLSMPNYIKGSIRI